jgi:RNA polymerase-binding transcription factor DksA
MALSLRFEPAPILLEACACNQYLSWSRWREWHLAPIGHKVPRVPTKNNAKPAAKKAVAKKAAPAKKAVAKKAAPAKKAVAKKAVAKKAVAKKAAPAKKAPAKKAVAKKATPVKKSIPRPAPTKPASSKTIGKPFPAKAGSKTTISVDEKSQTVSVNTVVIAPVEVVVEERRLVMPPPPRPNKSGKKVAPLKPLKAAPSPLVAGENESAWTAAELKAIRNEISKELVRLQDELAKVEIEMDDLIHSSSEGAGDDQADAGTKTFEREHEMSLVINARDMVLQTERALERIDSKSYGLCEECGNTIGKARLQVFPRATLCMICKAKEERR